MRISDWSSDVCSSDLIGLIDVLLTQQVLVGGIAGEHDRVGQVFGDVFGALARTLQHLHRITAFQAARQRAADIAAASDEDPPGALVLGPAQLVHHGQNVARSEEHTSELQSLMRTSYAVFCLQKKTLTNTHH